MRRTITKIAVSLTLTFLVLLGCMSPDAMKAEIQGIRHDVAQKADNTVVTEQVEQINNRIDQTTQIAEELSVWRKNVQAGVINYGGGNLVIIGMSIMALIFVGSGLLLIRAFMKRGSSLALLTGAIKQIGDEYPDTARMIKQQLKYDVITESKFSEKDRQYLGDFAKKFGTFMKRK